MNYLSDVNAERLLEEAKSACDATYSPYSHYPVGAAVLMKDGQIFRGTNVENASYGLTICAERIALGNAVSNADTAIEAIAVYTEVGGAAPCGACRQFIIEFGKDIIVIFRSGGNIVQKTASQLLPFAFTKENLGNKNRIVRRAKLPDMQ